MLCGYTPEKSVRLNPCAEELDEVFWRDISPAAQDFVLQLLQRDPAIRLSGLSAASHPWLAASYSDADKVEEEKDRIGCDENAKL